MTGWIYEHNLDPVLVQLGPLRIGWYGLMYALAFLSFYWMMMRFAKKPGALVPAQEVPNLLTYVIVGVIVGGRLGWVVFYGGTPYLYDPVRILETWKGGMSFHGGMIGVAVMAWIYCRRHGISLLALIDYCGLWTPVGLGLGRIGNFINGELYGAPTDGTWGVIFPGDPNRVPRHPSQLYEAAGEGLLLFVVMLALRRWLPWRGLQAASFLVVYGASRTAVELIRLPDAHIGYLIYGTTMGQWLSFPMVAVGLVWIAWIAARELRPPRAET